MNSFSGFPEGKVRLTPIPAPFFSELLPDIDDLGELKLTVYVFWRLDHLEGAFRYLRESDFRSDARFMAGFAATPEAAEQALQQALLRAVQRGTLLRAEVELGAGVEILYFLNSPKGRAAVQAIVRGEWRPSGQPQLPVELGFERPNIFRLYEEHIGPLTPMIAESLREAEELYPAQWIEDAIRAAVENNKRSWRYAEAILRRWQEKGRDERKDRRDTEKDRRRYAEWED
jgi:DnaD/phage-associated family protein